MKTVPLAKVQAQFGSFVDASQREAIVVTRAGKPVAVLLGETDADEIERIVMAHSPKLNALLDAARARVAKGEFYTHDEFWAEVNAESAKKKVVEKPRSKPKRKSA